MQWSPPNMPSDALAIWYGASCQSSQCRPYHSCMGFCTHYGIVCPEAAHSSPGEDGAECAARLEHYLQVEPTADLSNLLTCAGHVGDAHNGWGVVLFNSARIT